MNGGISASGHGHNRYTYFSLGHDELADNACRNTKSEQTSREDIFPRKMVAAVRKRL
jgi:hypothetical protein